MFTNESKPRQTETQETTPAVQRGSGPEVDGGRTPQALWAHLRHELRTPLNAIIGFSEILLENAAEQGRLDIVLDLRKIHSAAELFLSRVHFTSVPPEAETFLAKFLGPALN